MSEAGYTLAETLVALMMIGLAMGGLTAGVHVIGMNQAAASHNLVQSRDVRQPPLVLNRLLDGQGPFSTLDAGIFHGDGTGFSFDCRDSSRCSADLVTSKHRQSLVISRRGAREVTTLPAGDQARFSYVGVHGASEQWPPNSDAPDVMKAVLLIDQKAGRKTAVASVRLWVEHGSDCVFDPVSRTCRAIAP